MQSQSYRDGIFSLATPQALYQSKVTSYGDGSLGGCSACAGGLGDAGKAHRDGIFSTTTPRSPYGSGLQAYADGALGALDSSTVLKYGLGALAAGAVVYMVFGKKKGRRKK